MTPDSHPHAPSTAYAGHSHSFDVGIAKLLGVNAAIVFNHIVYWLRINAAKGSNFIDGRTWMYETQAEMAAFLEYMTLEEVKKSVVKLLDAGLLIKGNYNKNAFDKTSWYTTSDKEIIEIKKTLSKAPYGAIDNAPGRDPLRPTAPSLYTQENNQKNKQEKSATQRAGAREAPEQMRCAALLKSGDLGQEEQGPKPVTPKESQPRPLKAPPINQNSTPAVLSQKDQNKGSCADSDVSGQPRDLRGRPVDIDSMESDIYMRLGSTYDAGTIKAAIHRVKCTKSPIGDVFRLTETICQAILAETDETPKKKKRPSDELPPNVKDWRGKPTISIGELDRLEAEGKLEEFINNLKKQGLYE